MKKGAEFWGAVIKCKSVEELSDVIKKPQTNADRIRSLSDEELADIITDDWCELLNCESPCDGHCDLKVLKWLQQEVTE